MSDENQAYSAGDCELCHGHGEVPLWNDDTAPCPRCLQTKLDEARETNRKLHRRTQQAEKQYKRLRVKSWYGGGRKFHYRMYKHMQHDRKKLDKTIEVLQTELDEANETIEQLPLTGNGVRVVPGRDVYGFNVNGEVEPHMVGMCCVDSTDGNGDEIEWDIEEPQNNEWYLPNFKATYSTREDAEAAKGATDETDSI